MMYFAVVPFIFAAVSATEPNDHCTAIVAGRKATKHGSTLVGQTVDFEGGPGSSFHFVPAQNHAPGTLRPILDQVTGEKIGTIPQVNHTYAYTWASYGLMNEHKLAFGESTVSGRLAANSLAHNGTALFSNDQLSKIALERCKTARCAVETMGHFAMQGGFYGEGFDVDTGSENLVVADPQEAFVFHILADPTGKSAIWAAQRVPDDQVVVVPNAMVIREMDLKSDDFYLSSTAIQIAREYGWWDGKGPFSFAGTFGLGEYEHPFYGGRRLWRAYDLFAPSLKLDPTKEITPASAGYPFGVKPDKLLTVEDVFKVYRDYLEGTPYSLVKDELAAGPFSSPRRIAGGDNEAKYKVGGWERPISIYRNDYAVINECRADGPGVVWVAPHTPHSSVFAPIWTNAATAIPRSYVVDTTKSVDRESLFWAASAVGNWAHGSMFSLAIQDIRDAQQKTEQLSHKVASQLSTAEPKLHNGLIEAHAKVVYDSWWGLFWDLMAKYNDGYVVTRDAKGAITPATPGYPSWYLKAVDYKDGVGGCSAEAYDSLNQRMAAAIAEFKKIDAKRHHGALDQIVV